MLIKLLKKLSDDAGQVAVVFALAIIPIFAVAGFASDFQTPVKKKQKVQVIVDSAVLAAARVKQTGATDGEVRKALSAFLDAQLDPIGGGLTCDTPIAAVGTSA